MLYEGPPRTMMLEAELTVLNGGPLLTEPEHTEPGNRWPKKLADWSNVASSEQGLGMDLQTRARHGQSRQTPRDGG